MEPPNHNLSDRTPSTCSGKFMSKTILLLFQNIDLPSVSKDMFQGAIRYLDISYNSFGELPSDTFSDLTSIGVISLYGLDIECTCSKLWFLGYALDKHLTLEGDIICVNSSSWDSKCFRILNIV